MWVILAPAFFKQDTNSYRVEDHNSAVPLTEKLGWGPQVCLPVPKHSAEKSIAKESFTKKSKPSADATGVTVPGPDRVKKPSRGSVRREQKQEVRFSPEPKDADSGWTGVEGNSQANDSARTVRSVPNKNGHDAIRSPVRTNERNPPHKQKRRKRGQQRSSGPLPLLTPVSPCFIQYKKDKSQRGTLCRIWIR